MFSHARVLCRSGFFVFLLIIVAITSVGWARKVDAPAKKPTMVVPPSLRDDRPLGYVPSSLAAPSDTFILGEFTFNPGGAPDPQGWTSLDLTAQIDTFFHIDDFAGLGGGESGFLVPLEGNQSFWCGQRPTTGAPFCNYATLPGYGNNWSQRLESVAFATTGDVTLSYHILYETEPGYDEVFVEYLTKSGNWQTEKQFSGYRDSVETIIVPADSLDGEIRLRFRFVSDGAWSDEDGMWPTDGAVIVDSITVSDGTGVIDFQDFETEPVGAHASADGDWQASFPAPYGSFAGLFSGALVLQEDPCVTNLTTLWGFFNGSTYDFSCGGHPEQAAVPFGEEREGVTKYLRNEIWSPRIDFTQDKDGTPVPASAEEVLLEFDMYGDLPIDNLIAHNFLVRSWISGCPGEWGNFSSFEFANQKLWLHRTWSVASLLDAGTEEIQVGVFVIDTCPFWCNIFGSGACHSHGPLYDNFKVSRVDHSGPRWTVRPFDLFQDNFAADGTKTGTVRMDIANDVAPSSSSTNVPGDSAQVDVFSSAGLDNHMTGVPSSGPAVYCHVKDISGAKSGAAISGDLGRYPLVSTAAGWTVLRFDTVKTAAGAPLQDRFNIDLNDNLYTPGDTVYYYFSARDINSVTTYFSQLAGVTDSEAEARALAMEMTCLPANALGGQTDILYVDDYDNRGAQPYFDTAFEVLGLTPDRYDVLGASAIRGNGPGGRVVNVLQQLVGCYRKIIWNSGDLTNGLIGDGTPGLEKSDDFAMLFQFLDLHPGGAGVYISGDNIAEEWVTLIGAGATGLQSTYMNFNLVGGDHIAAGQPTTPLAIGQPGSCFGTDTLLAYGGCPTINNFDVLVPTGASQLEMAYSNNLAHGAVISQITANSAGDTARVLLSGFSYHEIRDDKVQFPPDRVEHLLAILRWLDNAVSDPTAIGDVPQYESTLAQNYPNPFNPTTTVRYSVGERGHVSLRIYNVAGQLVRTLVNEEKTPRGEGFTVVWDGRDNAGQFVSSGIYFYRLATPTFTDTKKMVMLK